MSVDGAMLDIAQRLVDAGIDATADPRGANPPCVLVTPPNGTVDIMCGSASGTWALYALAPATGNLDAAKVLGEMLASVVDVLAVERFDFVSYSLGNDNPPFPAYRIQFTEAFEL